MSLLLPSNFYVFLKYSLGLYQILSCILVVKRPVLSVLLNPELPEDKLFFLSMLISTTCDCNKW